MRKIRYNLILSDDLNTKIMSMANSKNISMSEVIRRAVSLYYVAFREEQRGNKISITAEGDDKVLKDIIVL